MVKVRSTKKSPSQRRDPRLRYLVEAETAEQFWTNQKWPADSSEYVFLARAFNLIGTKQCGPEWTGKEWSKAADLSDWITAREVRRIKVQNEMIEAMEKGELISGYRALSGGRVIVMPRYFWNSEVSLLQNRFELCRIDIGEPFKRISNPIKGSWIYIALKSLHRYVGVKAERRTKGSIKGTRLRGAIEALDALYPAGRFPAGVTNTIILAEVNSWLKTKGRQDVSLSSIRRAREVASFYTRSLIRVWKSDLPFEPARMLGWLRTRHSYSGTYSGATDELRGAIATTPERLQEIVDSFLQGVEADDNRWGNWHELRELTFFQLGVKDLLARVVKQFAAEPAGTQKEVFLYEVAFSLAYADAPNSEREFELLYDLPSSLPHLLSTRDASITTKLPKDYYVWKLRRKEEEEKYDPEGQRAAFANDADAIRNGTHLGWLSWAASIYFGLYRDVDQRATPQERLVKIIGGANAKIALAGLEAMLRRADVPTFDDMMERISVRKTLRWWHGLVAGLNERWQRRPDFEGVPQDLLRALVAFNLVNPVAQVKDNVSSWLTPPWKQWLLDYQPDLVRDAYMAVIRTRLKVSEQIAEGMRELLTESAFEAFRRDIVMTLLREFPNADPFRLDELIGAALKLPDAHKDFLVLASQALSGAVAVDQRQRDLWLTAAYMLAPNEYQAVVEREAKARPGLVFDLRDRSGFERHGQPGENALSLAQLEFAARLTGALYPAASPPSGGWSGNTNRWDASEFFRGLTAMISANPTQAATDALVRLEANPDLRSYSEPLRHDLANQQQLRRDADYDRPDWARTIKSLENGAPATVADLNALLIDHLHDVRRQIERDNADIFKSFWNLDSYSRLVDPRPEEACRDFLVSSIRPQLAPFGITVEPEGHMAGDRRADISVAMPGKKILCELKRDYHADVWTAAEGQLDRFYTHDPEAKGFGIYCVFWFGDKRPKPIPKPAA